MNIEMIYPLENKYKLGQKVGLISLDEPYKIFPAWVIGTDLEKDKFNHWRVTYKVADKYSDIYNSFSSICDGVPEDELRDEMYINQ